MGGSQLPLLVSLKPMHTLVNSLLLSPPPLLSVSVTFAPCLTDVIAAYLPTKVWHSPGLKTLDSGSCLSTWRIKQPVWLFLALDLVHR